ncbi:ankyrin-1-like [Mercenaria mercenaria]|uniref:ankyrin-1-like n=1 Tax=Mercenaria mercenaria TaxID=6596 RepID=UPI00234F56DC|nr:ankyrin-1-like [Mercenaria mercenaria]
MASGSVCDFEQEIEEEGEEICDIYKEHLSLLEAVKNHNCAVVHDLVHNRGLSPDFNVDGHTPICRAAQFGYVDILDILVEGGCSLLTPDADVWRRQALHIAASKGHIEFLKRLLGYGADINSRDNDQRTPLHWAATYGNPDMVEFLISQGAAVNIAQCDGFTPLHAATCLGHNNVVKVLMKHGGEINRSDRDGWSAFHTAVCYGHKEVVKTLLDAGASLMRLTTDEENVVHIAASSGKIEVLKLLLERNVKLNDLNINGNTAFYLSVYYNELNMAKYLIKVGADMYLPSGPKKSPFYLAAMRSNLDFIAVFMEAGYNLSREEWILQKDFPQILLRNPELCNLLYKSASNPQKLKELCRSCIRKSMKFDENFDRRIEQLNLPVLLKHYVTYAALDSIVTHVSPTVNMTGIGLDNP